MTDCAHPGEPAAGDDLTTAELLAALERAPPDTATLVADWLRMRGIVPGETRWSASAAYRAWQDWVEFTHGFRPLGRATAMAWGQAMVQRLKRGRNNRGKYYYVKGAYKEVDR